MTRASSPLGSVIWSRSRISTVGTGSKRVGERTSAWLETARAPLANSSWKSLFSRSVARRPTTTAKTMRIASVRPADTAASRQRMGQRRGARITASTPGAPLVCSGGFILRARRPHHVPGAALRVKHARLAARFELASQVRDEDVDGVRERHRVVAPDLLQQPLAGDHEALVAHQVLEQLELAVGELDLPIAALHLV